MEATSSARTLPDLLEAAATRWPDRLALQSPQISLGWNDLRDAVRRLAGHLATHGVQAGQRVGLCVQRGPWPFLGSAALLSLGAGYVPLDPAHPPERLRFVLGDAGVRQVLADPAGTAALAGSEVKVIELDAVQLQSGIRDASSNHSAPEHNPDPDDIAYVIYTSGSTGRPKGVQVRHRNVLSMLAGLLPQLDLGQDEDPDEVWALLHGHTFDVSVFEMWGAVASGARMVTLTEEIARDPWQLAEELARHGVTTLSVVPSVFRHLAETVVEDQIDLSLRRVLFAGEKLDRRPVRRWRQTPAGAASRWFNAYGITEAAVHSTFRELTPDDLTRDEASTPIGRALPGSPILLLGPDLTPQPPGQTGEIVVGGAQVTAGYLNRDELTQERYGPVPGQDGRWYRSGDLAFQDASGDLHYVGRMDDQVKINGIRIELGEVEHALRSVPWIHDAVVIAAPSARGENQLVAFLVPTEHAADHDQVRSAVAAGTHWRGAMQAALDQVLPTGLWPQRVSVVPQIPQNANGKADRRALAQTLT